MMQTKDFYYGKRYKTIKYCTDIDLGKLGHKNTQRECLYDPLTNRILVLGFNGEYFWVELSEWICSLTWPVCRTGRWPDPEKTYITREEVDEIEKDWVGYMDDYNIDIK